MFRLVIEWFSFWCYLATGHSWEIQNIWSKIKDDFLFPADCQLAISDWMLSDLQFRAESEDFASVSVFYTLSGRCHCLFTCIFFEEAITVLVFPTTENTKKRFFMQGGMRARQYEMHAYAFFKVCLVLIFLNTIVEKTYPESWIYSFCINFMLKKPFAKFSKSAT